MPVQILYKDTLPNIRMESENKECRVERTFFRPTDVVYIRFSEKRKAVKRQQSRHTDMS